MIRIYCSKADATLQETETLTAGMVNTPVVQFTFSSDWDGLGKSAIVRAGTVIKEVVVSNNQIVVPSECLAKAGVNLIIGVWGGNFTTELPTVWCACGEIQDATNPNSALNHEEATPSNVAQMLAAAERAEAALDQIKNANWDDVAQKVGAEKVNKPLTNPNGTAGQILKTNGDGSTQWIEPEDLLEGPIEESVNAWLDEHPEATTTVEDGSITADKLSSSLKLEEPVNVLYLGIKNDGSSDCSELVNQYTQQYELYFPTGIYKVDHPIYLVKSIYGAGATRQFSARAVSQGTRFLSNITGDTTHGVINANGSGIEIKDIHVICNETEHGIMIAPVGSAKNFRVDNCTVSNVSGIGIYCDSVAKCSRLAYITECSVFGARGGNSVGIQIGHDGETNDPDCWIRGCEIMATQQGIKNYGGILRISQVHIWTGKLDDSSYADTWWENTRGIVCYNLTSVEDAYIDTAYEPIYVGINRPVEMRNILIWDDGTGNRSTKNASYLISVYSNNSTNTIGKTIHVDGLIARMFTGTYAGIINSAARYSQNVLLENIRTIVDNDAEQDTSNVSFCRTGLTQRSDRINILMAGSKLTEIANIDVSTYGSAKIVVNKGSAVATINVNASSKELLVRKECEPKYTPEIYCSFDSTNKILKVYCRNTNSGGDLADIYREAHGYVFMTTYASVTASNEVIKPPTLDSTTGLDLLDNTIVYTPSTGAKKITDKYVVACLGDGLTYGVTASGGRASPTWPEGVANNTGYIVLNKAVEGAGICTNDTSTIINQLNNLSSSNPNPSVDCLVISAGTNDFGSSYATSLGTIEDTAVMGKNFYAAFKQLVGQCINLFPSANTLIVTPPRRNGGTNESEITLQQIVDAEVEVAKRYGVKCLNFYDEGGFQPGYASFRTAGFATTEGLHPTQLGYDTLFTPKLTQAIKQLVENRP